MEIEKNEKLETLTWDIFLMKLGFGFKRELTKEEKQEILQADPNFHQKCIDETKKVLEKKEKSLLNKKYPVIEVPASGKPNWGGGAYCLCFVYSKYNGNFVLKGYLKEVEEYLKKNYTHYFYNKSLWHHGFYRDIWGFWKDGVGIFEPIRSGRGRKQSYKIEVRPYVHWMDDVITKKEKSIKILTFKRLPKRWIPEFDNL